MCIKRIHNKIGEVFKIFNVTHFIPVSRSKYIEIHKIVILFLIFERKKLQIECGKFFIVAAIVAIFNKNKIHSFIYYIQFLIRRNKLPNIFSYKFHYFVYIHLHFVIKYTFCVIYYIYLKIPPISSCLFMCVIRFRTKEIIYRL